MTSSQTQPIQFNGNEIFIEQSMTVTDLLQQQSVSASRFVVVINDEIVSKSNWTSTLINTGDQIDIMSPISGG